MEPSEICNPQGSRERLASSPGGSIHDDDKSSQTITDVVCFSLCSLSHIRLNHLYPEEYHENFRKSTIKRMVEHFCLPPKVENSVREFVSDDEFTFLSSIKHNHRGKVFRLIEELVLLSISSGIYDARMHYLIIDIAELLGIPRDLVEMHCESIYELLLNARYPPKRRAREKQPSHVTTTTTTSDELRTEQKDAVSCNLASHQAVAMSNEQDNDEIDDDDDAESKKYREQRDTKKKIKKYLMIGLASLGGGAVIGVTGGLAAPIVASAFGAAIGAGSFVLSSAAAGVVGSLFGVAGAGLTASKMQKRIGDLEEFSFQSLSPEHDQTSLTITIAISGWITDESEQQFSRPWRSLWHTKEQYCLRYESKYLLELSQAMDYLLSFVVSYAAQEALKYTFLAGVMAAIAWPTALISMANIIDNPWDVCIGRSAEAGKHLADVLMSRQQGRRPVSLIGFSLGARVIYFCLQELARRPNSEGIVCDVVLLGAPVTASQDQWKPLGRVLSGRVINGYSSSDWLLKFLYRTSSAAIRVAGLQPLCWHDRRVRNVDLTQLVGGHMDYYKKLTEILQFVGVRTKPVAPKATEDEDGAAALGEEAPPRQTTSSCSNGHAMSLSCSSCSADSGLVRSESQATDVSALHSLSQLSLQRAAEAANSASNPGDAPQVLRTAEARQQMATGPPDEGEHNNDDDDDDDDGGGGAPSSEPAPEERRLQAGAQIASLAPNAVGSIASGGGGGGGQQRRQQNNNGASSQRQRLARHATRLRQCASRPSSLADDDAAPAGHGRADGAERRDLRRPNAASGWSRSSHRHRTRSI